LLFSLNSVLSKPLLTESMGRVCGMNVLSENISVSHATKK
jgi:hypothetical protein